MVSKVDMNADMGESFGDWVMGNDAALLDVVTSANIACGFHAGDPDVMAKTMGLAMQKGVGLGAHPGFADLQGFGRRRLLMSDESLRNLIAYQIGAAQGMARACGGALNHLKLHGALSNMASDDLEMARVCLRAVQAVAPDLVVMVLAGTALQQAAEELGCAWAGEIFADRAYHDDATLVGRDQKGAVIHDAQVAAKRVLEMVQNDAIIAVSGKKIPVRIDTICVHGDTPNAIEIARAVRAALEGDNIAVTRLAVRG